VQDGAVMPTPFLDIISLVNSSGSEQGLLGLAFHPRYSENGFFYVHYSDLNGDTAIARYQVSADPNVADPTTASMLLQIDQPYSNHNGGHLLFGPDGYLYIGMGDGGSGGDPHGNGQNPTALLGKMLRIDVDGGSPYAIPWDNPFVNTPDARGEIWATGLRNPWRYSFDRLTGDLYIADVGQNEYEEVNFAPLGTSGLNYGWNRMEGTHCFRADDCDRDGLVLPIGEYDHDEGCSITGGNVYRGSAYPALFGGYFFGDFCSGRIWSLHRDAGGAWIQTELLESDAEISAFGEDTNGELYLTSMGDGAIYQLTAAAP
jgi:glucose/arabinose dehydrogenase